MEGAAILEALGISEEEKRSVSEWQQNANGSEEQARRHKEWIQVHVGRATASMAGRLVAGMLKTTQEKIEDLCKLSKSDLQDLAESVKESTAGIKKDIAEKIVDKVPEQIPKGLISYAEECALECMTNQPIREEFSNQYTARGHEMELPTVHEFMRKTGVKVTAFGDGQEFIKPKRKLKIEGHGEVNLAEHVGCTPDGLIGNDTGFEGKARSTKEHWKRLRNVRKQEDLLKHDKEVYWQIMMSLWITGRKHWIMVVYDDRFTEEFAHLRMRIVKIKRNELHIKLFEARVKQFIKIKLDTIKEGLNMAA